MPDKPEHRGSLEIAGLPVILDLAIHIDELGCPIVTVSNRASTNRAADADFAAIHDDIYPTTSCPTCGATHDNQPDDFDCPEL